jgi:Ni/Fe-hydrogenase subunit HybB-like protein
MEVATSFFEWMGWPAGKKAIRHITLGLTVAGIILSTLHQGALGALFTYAPGKVHPLWYSSAFQWLHFFVSSLPGGLCMVIVVSTIAAKTMSWRFDKRLVTNFDKVTISLAKGATMGLATYLTIKLVAVAHDNKWEYLTTGWGAWYIFEICFGVILPLIILSYAINKKNVSLIRFGALLTVLGVVLNRLNTAIITFNWKLPEREIPHWREFIIAVTVFSIGSPSSTSGRRPMKWLRLTLQLLHRSPRKNLVSPRATSPENAVSKRFRGAPEKRDRRFR